MKKMLIEAWNLALYFSVNVRFFYRKLTYGAPVSKTGNDMRSNGIVKLKCNGLSAYLLPHILDGKYLNQKQDEIYLKHNISNEHGLKGVNVELESSFLWKYIFTKENYEILRAYYRGDFYLRNNPYISISYDGEVHGAQNYHVDWGLRQCSIMVNLTDITNGSTHMEYLLGTNRRYWFFHPNRLSKKFKAIVEKLLSSEPELKFTTKENSDTLFIFDAGNGLHRQVGGGKRIILHLNFVDNLAYCGWKKAWTPSKDFQTSHWVSERTEKVDNFIAKSGFPRSVFSLVLQEAKPTFFTPSFYTENYN